MKFEELEVVEEMGGFSDFIEGVGIGLGVGAGVVAIVGVVAT